MPNRLLPARMARSAAVPTVPATIPFPDIGHHVMVDMPRATNGDCAGGSIKSACRLVLTEPEDESPYIGSGLLGQHPLKISLASAQSGRWRRTNSEQDSWMVAKVCKWDRNSM